MQDHDPQVENSWFKATGYNRHKRDVVTLEMRWGKNKDKLHFFLLLEVQGTSIHKKATQLHILCSVQA